MSKSGLPDSAAKRLLIDSSGPGSGDSQATIESGREYCPGITSSPFGKLNHIRLNGSASAGVIVMLFHDCLDHPPVEVMNIVEDVPAMTFGIGIKVREGVVALADTQIVLGSEKVSKQKLAALFHADDSLFAMSSGLRSVRDKTLAYLSERLRNRIEPIDRLHQVVNMFGEELRRVREEDGPSLARSNISFNTHAIIGGCFGHDPSPQLFYVYPEGNWIETAADSPYFIIGRTSYGKPILDRLLRYDTPLRTAVALALLAFDATRASVTDVDCPIDVAVVAEGNRHATFSRFTQSEISPVTDWWSRMLADALTVIPMEWASRLFKNYTPGGHE